MTGPSVKEFNQYQKAEAKINTIINKYESIEKLKELLVEHTYNNNYSLKTARNAIRKYNYHKKSGTFESKYGNLDNNLNHHSPPQDARSSEQDQLPLSLPFTNVCPVTLLTNHVPMRQNKQIDEDNDNQPIKNRDSIQRQDVDRPINEYQPILLSYNNCKRSQSTELIEKYGNDSPYFNPFYRHGTHQV